jgi:RNA polymerase sigma factor (TIGR02999 family)
MGEVTHILRQLAEGDDDAMERLLPLVYEELRALARHQLGSQRVDHTLSPTALVHEAFLRLVGPDAARAWENRVHFFAVASKAMRSVLVDHARRRLAHKRQYRDDMVTFGAAVRRTVCAEDLVAIDIAMDKLALEHARQASVVELSFFGGLTHAEIALALGVSEPTVRRDWRFARAWLSRELEDVA